MLPVINPAASLERAMQPMNDVLARIKAATKLPTGLMELSRQMRELETAMAPPTGLMESWRQLREAVPTIEWALAAPPMQSYKEREPEAPIAPVANSRVAPAVPAPCRKQNRGNRTVRPGTVAAAVAIGLYVAHTSYDSKLTANRLAKLAADFAAEQGLHDADNPLDPRGSTMRTLAAGYLAGWKAMKVAAQNRKIAH
jgi:hypothetical protein